MVEYYVPEECAKKLLVVTKKYVNPSLREEFKKEAVETMITAMEQWKNKHMFGK